MCSVMKSRIAGEAMFANTLGEKAWPQPLPNETIPTALPSCIAAPPESPWNFIISLLPHFITVFFVVNS